VKGADRIATEIVQRLTAAQAWEYGLVPCGEQGGTLECYGDGRDYGGALMELEVLYGIRARVKAVAQDELQKLLRQYYRNDKADGRANVRRISDIASGQGFLMGLIEEAFDSYASDIHIETYEERCRVRLRIDGRLIERYVIERGNYSSLVNQIKIVANLDISEKRLPQDGRILFNSGGKKFDVRVSCLPTIYGEKIVLRLLTRHVELLELANLGFSERQLEDYCAAIGKPYGMVLICGPTGSGKSTTLYATLRRLNRETDNILTIEDPVEYTLEGVNQVQLKEEIGMTFGSALRTFLRQDPDIIMLGEIRDGDTAQMAIRSSLTGHLIFSTIHTNTAWGSIARLADMGVHPYLIANTLVMCVAQRLVRLLCPHCKRREGEYYEAVGCEKCYYTGYSGRRAVYEVITMDDELAAAARANEPDIQRLLSARGVISLREAALEMLAAGDTSYSEIITMLQ
jgi:general secretion pathway protein E/type IV pilus assembly protein PilB